MLACLFAGLVLMAVVTADGRSGGVNGVLMALGGVVGVALLMKVKTWWQVMDSLLNSQRKRLHSAANRMHKLKSEGFMKASRWAWPWGGVALGAWPDSVDLLSSHRC